MYIHKPLIALQHNNCLSFLTFYMRKSRGNFTYFGIHSYRCISACAHVVNFSVYVAWILPSLISPQHMHIVKEGSTYLSVINVWDSDLGYHCRSPGQSRLYRIGVDRCTHPTPNKQKNVLPASHNPYVMSKPMLYIVKDILNEIGECQSRSKEL